MFGLRLLLLFIGAALVTSLLGYALSKDRRWLDVFNFTIKTGIAVGVVLGLVFLLARFMI